MFYLFLFISLSISICDDVHIWISSIEDDKIELSIKSDEPIFITIRLYLFKDAILVHLH